MPKQAETLIARWACARSPQAPAAFALVLGIVASSPAPATEGGGTAKILGVETVLAGVMPQPGHTRVLVAAGTYDTTRSLDGRGNTRAPLTAFHLRASGLTLRVQHVWHGVKWFGADVETRLGMAVHTDTLLSLDLLTPGGRVHRAGEARGHGDVLLAPVTLGWHSQSYHQIAGLEFYAPAARFDATRLANKGRGYWAVAPAYRFTWLPTAAVELSGNLVLLLNRENPDTRVRSGRELSFDYGLGHTVAAGWQLGVSGYAYRQLGDDLLRRQRVEPDGNRGRVLAAGPFVRWFNVEGTGVTLKWQTEAAARNKTRGQRAFLQFTRTLD